LCNVQDLNVNDLLRKGTGLNASVVMRSSDFLNVINARCFSILTVRIRTAALCFENNSDKFDTLPSQS